MNSISVVQPLRKSPLFQNKSHKSFLENNKYFTKQQNRSLSLRVKASGVLPDLNILAAVAPPEVKLSVLLKTGGVCLFAYWIVNFVVPEFVLKDLQSKGRDEKNGENEDEEESL